MSFRLKCLTGESLQSANGAAATTATTATNAGAGWQGVATVATVAVAAERKREYQERAGALARFSEPDRGAFERIAAALRAELARRPKLAGIAAYRPVLDPQTGEPLTAIVSARRHSDGTVTVAEIAGDWADPTLPDLERWTPPGGAS